MSKVICTSAIEGAIKWVARAEAKLKEAISLKGESCSVGFPDTAYFLPVIYSFTGEKVETLGDMRRILDRARNLLPEIPSTQVWLPYLGHTLDAGAAALFACEIIEACKALIGPPPVDGIWLGAASDRIMRERGIEFVDGSAPGFAAVTGVAPTNEIAVRIARELQEKNMYVFMAGCTNGRQFAEQLQEEGVQLGWETRLVPYGRDVSALIYALGFASRAALSFGGVGPGDFAANLKYNKNRIFAFVLTLGEVTPDKYAVAAGAINYGFPTIADTDIPEILPTGVCTYEHVVSRVPHNAMVERALEVRGCKVKITRVPIPVPYSPAFEGERIRKGDVHAEFGGNKTPAFEFVTSVDLDQITDGEIELIGPDIDAIEPGAVLPLAIWVEVAGRKMQTDFEPILERQIHHFLNGAEGVWHMGQRDIIWTRISRSAFARGFRIKHYGEIIHAKFLSEYPAIVDKVKLTLITDEKEVLSRIGFARTVYDKRNRRLQAMTDESADTFYSCLLCQSFAPNHVCIITPERAGLCGAYNWLDGKAAYEIDETGPNQPVKKGECLDPLKGIFKGINDYVFIHSHKTTPCLCMYSLMDRPMTSCGCFEVICAYVPGCGGVMAVNREYQGDTPVGMSFATLAGDVGGGQQTPGFMGCGKVFLTSKKFLLAEGGHKRLVWMPKELKDLLAEDLKIRFGEQGAPDLLEKIADETIGTDARSVQAFLEKVDHPVLHMPDMTIFTQRIREESLIKEDTGETATPTETKSQEQILSEDLLTRLKDQISAHLALHLKTSITNEVVDKIIDTIRKDLIGKKIPSIKDHPEKIPGMTASMGKEMKPADSQEREERQIRRRTAAERIAGITAFTIRREKCELPIYTVKIGATKDEGGTRGRSYSIGGASCMPFHLWEGQMPHRPLVAMEVFDRLSEKYPPVLREIFGEIAHDPAQMARACVEKYGADLISVRLEGTHPEKGNRQPEQAVELVKAVLQAVDVPLIITGHSHFDRMNAVMKAVAQACAGENLLLNWVEQENYRTIAGSALAYGHSLVAQSPIDVNIGKQLNILLTSMNIKPQQIVMDPMTGATGYGIEYSYSVMERIRMTGLGGDKMLAFPMIVSPGRECIKIKEFKAAEKDYPAWGDLEKRAALWELSTALAQLYAGADILILYHPQAAMALKRTILRLMENDQEIL